jgi:pyruvate,water dikinase
VAAAAESRDLIAEFERMVHRSEPFGRHDVHAICAGALARAREAVAALEHVTGQRERRLARVLDRVSNSLATVLREDVRLPTGPLVLDFADLGGVSPALVGSRLHRLAKMRLAAGAPVPDGFAITSSACHALLAQPGPWPVIQRVFDASWPDNRARLTASLDDIRACIVSAPWPDQAAAQIVDAFDRLVARSGGRVARVAVRPGAAGDAGDGRRYASTLNVDRNGLLAACSHAVASQFGPGAVYWNVFRDNRCVLRPMSVSVTLMVDILASGVLQTRVPDEPATDMMLVRGVWGLSWPVTGAPSPADLIRVSRREGHHIVVANIASKTSMRLAGVEGGVITVDVPSWMRDQPCLTRAQAGALAAYGLRLEEEFNAPQDVDWVLDRAERIVVMRSRPSLVDHRPGQTTMESSATVRLANTALAIVAPLTLPAPNHARVSPDACVTLHDAICYAYEQGVRAAGIAGGPPDRWPGRLDAPTA